MGCQEVFPQAIVGAIGVLLAVPLTTAIAAWLAGPAGTGRNSRFATAARRAE